MKWARDIALGIPELDKEHRLVFSSINSLVEAIRRKARWSDIHSGLIEVNELSMAHFDVEEALMQIHGFPGSDTHIEQHRQLASRLQELLRASLTRSITVDEVNFLETWWPEHIIMSDGEYAAWFKRAGPASLADSSKFGS